MRWSDWALWQLLLARLREFYRDPKSIFWVYGFPMIMTGALGLAFRDNPEPQLRVDVTGQAAQKVLDVLAGQKTPSGKPRYLLKQTEADAAGTRLRAGKTDVIVNAWSGGYEYEF